MDIFKLFTQQTGIELSNNSESYTLTKGEDFEDNYNLIPDGINDILAHSVSLKDDIDTSLVIVTNIENDSEIYFAQIIGKEIKTYDSNFNLID